MSHVKKLAAESDASGRAGTPVGSELERAIREVDRLLIEEFGCDFAYAILARGEIVAASNARNGVVPPVLKATGQVG